MPDPESSLLPLSGPEPELMTAVHNNAGAKRKLQDEVTNGMSQSSSPQPNRPKTSSMPTDQLDNGQDSTAPAEEVTAELQPSDSATAKANVDLGHKIEGPIWQQVFLHLSPAMLTRCLSVCKKFNVLLTATNGTNPAAAKKKAHLCRQARTPVTVEAFESDAIWARARKIWYPDMPKPLADLSEVQMFQLLGGTTCASCGKTPKPTPIPSSLEKIASSLRAGPGAGGVRIIWPFKIRSCGDCLFKKVQKVGWRFVPPCFAPY